MSATVEAAHALPAKIPIGRTLAEAYRTLLTNLWPFVKISAFPLLLSTLLPLASPAVYAPIKAQLHRLLDFSINNIGITYFLDQAGLEGIVEQALLAIPLTLFCSHWLQFLAAPDPGAATRPALMWTRRDLRVFAYFPLFLAAPFLFFLYRLGNVLLDTTYLNASFLLIDLAVKYGSWIIYLQFWGALALIVVANAFLWARFGPALAAASAGTRLGLRGAWRITRGQALRLIFLWLVLYHATAAAALMAQLKINAAYSEALDGGFDPSFGLIPTNNEIAWEAAWQAVQLPQSIFSFVALALATTVFLRIYRASMTGDFGTQQGILERFER